MVERDGAGADAEHVGTSMEEVDEAIYAIESLLAEICLITEKDNINISLKDEHQRRQVAVIIRRIIQRCLEAEKRLKG